MLIFDSNPLTVEIAVIPSAIFVKLGTAAKSVNLSSKLLGMFISDIPEPDSPDNAFENAAIAVAFLDTPSAFISALPKVLMSAIIFSNGVSPPKKPAILLIKLPAPAEAFATPAPASAVLNATSASAFALTLAPSMLASLNFFICSNGSVSPPNNPASPLVIPPTKEPKPATAVPAPNAAIAPDIAAIPFAASISLVPSNSSKPFIPSMKLGSALPVNQAAAAIPAPIAVITPATVAAPNNIIGACAPNALNPAAAPFIMP